MRCQNYTTLRRVLMNELKNVNDAIISLNDKNFDNNMNVRILTATIKFIKDSERFGQLLFKPLLRPFLFFQPLHNFLFEKSVILQLGYLT